MIKLLNCPFGADGDFPGRSAVFNATKSGKMNTTNSAAKWVGGYPVGMSTTGLVVGGNANQVIVTAPVAAGAVAASNFIGLMMNAHPVDIRRGAGDKSATDIGYAIPSIALCPCKVELLASVYDDVVDPYPPFLTTVTWAIWDKIYVAAHASDTDVNGRLTNAAAGSQTQPIGVVLKAPASATDTMIAMFFALPTVF